MTFEGGFKPFNRIGLSSSPSPFAKMSFESTCTFLQEATVYGDFDELRNPSARIVMGQPVQSGTGAFDVLVDLAVPASALACPLVYKTALIETADADGCEPQNVVSNLPFVCAEQFHRWIRNLAVATSFEVDIVCFYSSLSTLLLQYGDRLYTTTSISQESDFWAEHGHDDAEIDGTVARLHGAVSKAMPNVRHLFLRSWEPEGVLERVFGMLADAYADQISTLDMGDMLSLPQPWAPAISLQHLDIGLANYTNMKAMLCASSASLVSLTLRNTLEPGYLLRLPKLEELDMAHISASTRFVDICVFPPSVRAATLKLTLTGLEAMLKRKYGVPGVNKLVVHVYSSRNPELGDAAANHKEGMVNKFVKRYHGAKETVLFFGGGHELFCKHIPFH
ncbi:hypothetical protein GGI11_002221 [Coemansia sp. RSA 2049]|nr:hypothetical protein GGI11_002221 [Coemansia sp. RSA 2049]